MLYVPLISEKTVDYRSAQTLLNHPKITADESKSESDGAVIIEFYGMPFRYTH